MADRHPAASAKTSLHKTWYPVGVLIPSPRFEGPLATPAASQDIFTICKYINDIGNWISLSNRTNFGNVFSYSDCFTAIYMLDNFLKNSVDFSTYVCIVHDSWFIVNNYLPCSQGWCFINDSRTRTYTGSSRNSRLPTKEACLPISSYQLLAVRSAKRCARVK